MKLKFLRLEIVTVSTPQLCHHKCVGNTYDYPYDDCSIFNRKREPSESEDVSAYKRLPICIELAKEAYTPALPKIGDELTFIHQPNAKYKVAEVRRLYDDDEDWEVRLDPPLRGTFIYWEWIRPRYFIETRDSVVVPS